MTAKKFLDYLDYAAIIDALKNDLSPDRLEEELKGTLEAMDDEEQEARNYSAWDDPTGQDQFDGFD